MEEYKAVLSTLSQLVDKEEFKGLVKTFKSEARNPKFETISNDRNIKFKTYVLRI